MKSTSRSTKDFFFSAETGSLKEIYLLAISAFGHTHVVDQDVMNCLAEAVFEAYLDHRCPGLPLPSTLIEELAVCSTQTMLDSGKRPFILKQ